MTRQTVYLSEDTMVDLRWIQGITGDETISEAIGGLIGRECRALNGRYAEELQERRKSKRIAMRASKRVFNAQAQQ